MKTLVATFLIAGCAIGTGVAAQNATEPAPAAADCPAAAQAQGVQALYGRWRVRIADRPEAIAELHPHPDYPGVRGTLSRGATTAQLAGDIDDQGVLALDESDDGRSISAVWAVQLQPGSCGKEFKGTWQSAGDEAKQPVAMTKMSSAP